MERHRWGHPRDVPICQPIAVASGWTEDRFAPENRGSHQRPGWTARPSISTESPSGDDLSHTRFRIPIDCCQVTRMLKNFSPHSLGINGRQSELIELALTYGFRSMDVDLADMFRRSQRTSPDDAAKYLRATELLIGGFDLGINLDADDDGFTSQLGALHPLADFAAQLEAKRAYALIPAATDSMSYPEFFEVQKTRLSQIAEVLMPATFNWQLASRPAKSLTKVSSIRSCEMSKASLLWSRKSPAPVCTWIPGIGLSATAQWIS